MLVFEIFFFAFRIYFCICNAYVFSCVVSHFTFSLFLFYFGFLSFSLVWHLCHQAANHRQVPHLKEFV